MVCVRCCECHIIPVSGAAAGIGEVLCAAFSGWDTPPSCLEFVCALPTPAADRGHCDDGSHERAADRGSVRHRHTGVHADPAAHRYALVDARPPAVLPLGPGATRDAAALRLRLRSLDRRPGSVRLSAFAGRAPRAGERALAAGLDLPRLPGLPLEPDLRQRRQAKPKWRERSFAEAGRRPRQFRRRTTASDGHELALPTLSGTSGFGI